ncbi:MAG: GH32 C-terminal domain-containing protein, partial [Bacteroidaceae bacterium]
AKRFAVIIYNEKGEQVEISLKKDALGNHLQLNRLKSGILSNDMVESDVFIPNTASHQLRIFVDRTSVEVFLDNGRAVMSDLVFPSQAYSAVKFLSEGGKTTVSNLKAYRLSTKK